MPGYSRIDQYRLAGPLRVMGFDPATGEMVETALVQCVGCGLVITGLFTNEHDNLHGLLTQLLAERTPTAPVITVSDPTGELTKTAARKKTTA